MTWNPNPRTAGIGAPAAHISPMPVQFRLLQMQSFLPDWYRIFSSNSFVMEKFFSCNYLSNQSAILMSNVWCWLWLAMCVCLAQKIAWLLSRYCQKGRYGSKLHQWVVCLADFILRSESKVLAKPCFSSLWNSTFNSDPSLVPRHPLTKAPAISWKSWSQAWMPSSGTCASTGEKAMSKRCLYNGFLPTSKVPPKKPKSGLMRCDVSKCSTACLHVRKSVQGLFIFDNSLVGARLQTDLDALQRARTNDTNKVDVYLKHH